MVLNDKDWLEKVYRGFMVYKEVTNSDQNDILEFIKWLYKEYGIVYTDKREK